MGVYAEYDDIISILAPEGSPDNMPGLDEVQVEPLISQAEGIVDGYLRPTYTTPLDPPTKLIVGLTVDIAAYLTVLTYRKSTHVDENDPARLRYAMAQQVLQDIAEGKISIDAPPTDFDKGVYAYDQYTGNLWGPEDFCLVQTAVPHYSPYHYTGGGLSG